VVDWPHPDCITLAPLRRGNDVSKPRHLLFRFSPRTARATGKPRRRWGRRRGFQRAVRQGGLCPGPRTERRDQDDTPKGKMVCAGLPTMVNVAKSRWVLRFRNSRNSERPETARSTVNGEKLRQQRHPVAGESARKARFARVQSRNCRFKMPYHWYSFRASNHRSWF
jgi:hypothetical protein